jgi:pentatricopeptide repeat protein
VRPDAHVYAAMLRVLARAGEWEEALRLHQVQWQVSAL